MNPEIDGRVDIFRANSLLDYLTSEEAQQLIDGYRIDGQRLFTPTRLANDN